MARKESLCVLLERPTLLRLRQLSEATRVPLSALVRDVIEGGLEPWARSRGLGVDEARKEGGTCADNS